MSILQTVKLPQLNAPDYSEYIKIKEDKGHILIYDYIRRRWVKLSNEEWVRQNINIFISQILEVPLSKFANEVSLQYNGLSKRCDSIIYDDFGKPLIIIEYKKPDIKITQKIFDQIFVYNLQLSVPYLIISNGIEHYFCETNFEKKLFKIHTNWPKYKEIEIK